MSRGKRRYLVKVVIERVEWDRQAARVRHFVTCVECRTFEQARIHLGQP